MSYVVLARKWRPSQFSDIVGQGHVVRTLMNTIRTERIHQAYLFTGSRGIGKTSIARIFSKVIRCENRTESPEWLRSCDACSSCREITSGSGVDVMEIDGASNNGVDAVREIRESAKYLPASGNRKIYIIDEVHMLTTAAFNALLKTLEEPPPHVIFIFATTEPHKIPATILSRCQRFDFRRVTIAQIQSRLLEITAAEGIQAEPAALALVARAAEGSMRDALSLLDQVISYSGEHVTAATVRESVGLIESQTLLGMLRAILSRNATEALEGCNRAYAQGHDLRVLTRSLMEYLHGIILAKIGAPASASLDLSDDDWKEALELSRLRELEEIELIFQVFHHGADAIARSSQPKVYLDVLLIKCATAEALVSLGSLQQQQPQQQERQQPISQPAPSAPTPRPSTAMGVTPAPQPTQAVVAKTWDGFLNHVRRSRPFLATLLEHASSAEIPTGQTGVIRVFFQSGEQASTKQQQLQSPTYRPQLESLIEEFFGTKFAFETTAKENAGESFAARRAREQQERIQSAQAAVHGHPVIQEAKSLFGAELGSIELSDMNGVQ